LKIVENKKEGRYGKTLTAIIVEIAFQNKVLKTL